MYFLMVSFFRKRRKVRVTGDCTNYGLLGKSRFFQPLQLRCAANSIPIAIMSVAVLFADPMSGVAQTSPHDIVPSSLALRQVVSQIVPIALFNTHESFDRLGVELTS